MFAVGETLRLPERGTAPTPWLILTDPAFVDVQVSVVDWPDSIVSGEADSVTVGIGGAVTVTVAVSVTEPLLLVAVSV
jgi:hypothetical protein